MNTDDKNQIGLNLEREDVGFDQIRTHLPECSNVIQFEDALKFSRELLRLESINRIVSLREM